MDNGENKQSPNGRLASCQPLPLSLSLVSLCLSLSCYYSLYLSDSFWMYCNVCIDI